jgi:hypothetical protein
LSQGSERWPLLTFETEVKGDSKSTVLMKGVLPWLVRLGSSCQYTRFLSCSCQPSTKYSFLHPTLFQFMCFHRPATWAGSRAGPPVSECVSPIAHTKDGIRAKIIKAAHRTGLLCNSDFKVDLYVYSLLDYSILVDIINLIQHRTYRITVPLPSTPLNSNLQQRIHTQSQIMIIRGLALFLS